MGRNKKEHTNAAGGMNLPKAVYYQCIWTIKDMERLRMLEALYNYNELTDDPVCVAADGCTMVNERVIEEGVRRLRAVRAAIQPVPEEMRQDLIESITQGNGFADYAHENTWKKWKKRFISELAHNLDLV